jgi:phosphopantothenoylcysteine decarboxylase / phosphopantothenate---cysteine ligase
MPENRYSFFEKLIKQDQMTNATFKNKKVLITAGPTREAIDPVRYISNHSTGKMGYAIAEAFLNQGAKVILVSGPVFLKLNHPDLELVKVNSAMEMYLACCHYFEEVDIAVFAAAVADYRPAKVAAQKIKKETDSLVISLVKNVDIAFEFGRIKNPQQLSIGFALETHDELLHAKRKLDKKQLDMVVLNSMNDDQAGFGYDSNKIQIIKSDFTRISFPLKHKSAVAEDILQEIQKVLCEKENQREKLAHHLYEYSNY